MSAPTLAPVRPAVQAPPKDLPAYVRSCRARALALADAPMHARPGQSDRAHKLAHRALMRYLALI